MLSMPTADALSCYLDLAAQQMKLTAANMANQNTEGYTRRSVTFASGDSVLLNGTASNTGVVATVTAQRASVLQRAVLQANEASNASSTRLTALNNAQSLFAIDSNGEDASGISAAISDFFSNASTLAATPDDATARQTVYRNAQTLAGAMNRAATQIASQTAGLNQQVASSVSQVNGLLTSVASLNLQIVQAGVGTDTSSLQDQCDLAITQLSKLVDVNAIAMKDGSTALSLSDGTPLVNETNVSALSTTVVNGTVQIFSGTTHVTGVVRGGSIGGALQARDADLPAITAQLDSLASTIAWSVNTQNAAGIDANGNEGAAIFSGTTASALTVAISSGAGIAASGDGSNAAAIASLASRTPIHGLTLSGAFSAMITSLGQTASTAENNSAADAAVLSQTSTQLANISGVSLDTEAANLTQYQRSYQAAAKVMAIVNELMAHAINLGTGTTVS